MADAPGGGTPPPPWEERMNRRRERWEQKMDRHRLRWEARAMRRAHYRTGFGGAMIGLILAGIGVLLLLQNLGFVFVADLWKYWPAILIAFGLSRFFTAWEFGGRIIGGTIALVGTLILLRNLNILRVDVWGLFWPAILIAIGLGMLLRSIGHSRSGRDGPWWATQADFAQAAAASRDQSTPNAVKIDAVFSGANRRFDTQQFEGGEIHAVFGGVELDLRKAAIVSDHVRIDCNAVFGGIEIRVPDSWVVVLRGTGIFGGFSEETDPPARAATPSPVVTITGTAFFGGVNVKN